MHRPVASFFGLRNRNPTREGGKPRSFRPRERVPEGNYEDEDEKAGASVRQRASRREQIKPPHEQLQKEHKKKPRLTREKGPDNGVPDEWQRYRPHPKVHLPPIENVKNGLNGSKEYRQMYIYATDKPARKRRPKYPTDRDLFPPRPKPLTGRIGPFKKEKRWRVDIAHDTLEYLRSQNWKMWQPNRLNVRYEIPRDYNLPDCANLLGTKILVSSEDCFGAALRIIYEGKPQATGDIADIPLVQNMANRSHAGGGFLLGARAQEEDCCRRSDLYLALQYAEYPLPEFGAIYTYPVSILRDSKYEYYPFLKTSAAHSTYFPQVGVVSAAAYEGPKIDDDWRSKMQRKIESLLAVAVASGHRILILGAWFGIEAKLWLVPYKFWGCGAFKNPPAEVSGMFYRLLVSSKFNGRFKQVIFALSTRRPDNKLDDIARAFTTAFRCTMYRPPADLDIDRDPG